MGGTSNHEDPLIKRVAPPDLELLFETRTIWADPIDLGTSPSGRRLVTPLVEGQFSGSRLMGRFVPGACTLSQLVIPDGAIEVTGRIGLETDDGHRIFVSSFGLIWVSPDQAQALMEGSPYDPAKIYLRGSGHFHVADDGPYRWLNHVIFIYTSTRSLNGSQANLWRLL